MARIRLRRRELDGIELHYVSAGRGPVALLVHGLGGFAESWRRTLAALQPSSRVIAFDLPGFGQSSKPNIAYTIDFFANVVDEFLDLLEVERARLVGHSLGGSVALAYALAHPARVERLALLAAAVPGFPLAPSLGYRLMSLRGVGELVSALITPGICTAALRRCFAVPQADEIAFLVGHQYAARTTPEGRRAYLSALRAAKEAFTTAAPAYRAALAGWDRPTLMIHGRQDPVVPVGHARAAAEGIPHVEARWLDACGHFPHLEHGPVVHDWLGEFLLADVGR
jgi:pimeloyl-ACP methyl ester carboxylesterase